MPDLTVYHIKPHSAFHFGLRGIEQETTGTHFPADSLFAALLTTWLEIGHSPEELVRFFPRFVDNENTEAEGEGPPFLLSSMFPRAGQVRFYPVLPPGRMLTQAKLDDLHRMHRLKEIKKIRFISERLFETVTGGNLLDDWVPPGKEARATDPGLYLQKGAVWMTREEIDRLPQSFTGKPNRNGKLEDALRQTNVWHSTKVPRVTVDRLSNASQIFHTGRLQMNTGCGFWFGVVWRQPELRPAGAGQSLQQTVHHLLSLMADGGIGAERNAGYGHHECEVIDRTVSLPDPQPDGLFVTLSRYHPRRQELRSLFQNDRAAYNLAPVTGWLSSPEAAAQRRRRLWLFAEGSVLQAPSGPVWGNLVDVSPRYEQATFPHPVWRYGLACPVGLKEASHAL